VIAGTGVIGAVVHGSPSEHTVTLAHERFFVPANKRTPAPHLAPALPEIRKALAQNDSAGAAASVRRRLIDVGWDPDELIWTDPLAPLAEIAWSPRIREHAEYRRVIDTEELDVDISWRADGGRMGMLLRALHGSDRLQLELWSDVPVAGVLALRSVDERRSSAHTVATVDYTHTARTSVEATARELRARVVAEGVEPGTSVTAGVRVLAQGDLATSDGGWEVVLAGGVPLRFDVQIQTDAPGPRIDPREPAPSGARSAVRVAGSSAGDHVERVWDAARDGDGPSTSRVVEIAYAAGLRNIIASTGALPPTLQGVWQGTWSPAWSADYTLNGNVQLGTLAAALWAGDPALVRSLFRLVTQFPDHYRQNARAVFGSQGMLLPARMTTHGHANHFIGDYPHQFWIGHGSWLLRMAADYIQVTGDRSILDEWLWDYALEILSFGTSLLAAGGGHLIPSYSPENTPAGHDSPLVVDATADIAALRDGLRVGAWLADVRGEHRQAQGWREDRQALPPYRIADDGTLAEWADGSPEHMAHRHVSQLHGLWYELDEAFEDPALRDAALETVRRKVAWRAEAPFGPPGNMEMAFGLSSIALAAANLGDSESAYQCAVWLALDHFTSALVSTHDAGAIFNLDASGALPAVVAAMLAASRAGQLLLLPALPRAWAAGSITGLTARGGLVIRELVWDPQGLSCTIRLLEEAAWLRPESTSVLLPRPGALTVSAGGVTQTAPSELSVPSGARDVRFTFHFTHAEEAHDNDHVH